METSHNTMKLAQHNEISATQWKQATTQQNQHYEIATTQLN